MFRGEDVSFVIEDHLFQHGLSHQDSDRIRDPTRCFGDYGPGRVPGRILFFFFALVLVR